ncbi:MAG: secretin N-terminal domain-containing protein, partial [Phycisphaerae bacterium]
APKSLRQQIGQDIRMMDQQSGQRVIRQIPVVNADAESLARTLQDVFGGRRRGRGRRGGGAQDVQITGNSAAKTILVSAPQELFDQIEQLIRSMDVAGAAPLAVRVFHLQHARASEVLAKMQEMTRQVLQQVRATRRGMNLDIFAATADDRTNSLVVTGGELTFAIVEQVLKELDKEAAAPRMPALHTVQLSKSNARDVARAINNLFRGRRSRSPGEQPPRAEHDESTNTVLVYATAEEFKEIKEKIIDKLEEFQTPQAELKQYQIPLQYARAEEVAQTLSRYFRDRTAQARAAGVRGIKPSEVVTIVPDVTGNTLLVQCNEKNKAEIDQLLAKMDVESVKARGRSIKVFTLQYADPNAVANAIRSAFRQPGRARQSEADRVDAQPEWGTQSVVVSANEENMAKIEQMIAQLDVEATATKQITRIVKLEHAQARDVAEVLTRNLGQTRRRLRTGQMPVAVVANEPTNSLVVTASQTELPEIEQLIKTLDVPPDVQKDRIIKAIKLTYADPYAMANAIRNAFRPRGVRPRPEDIVVASGEWGTNSVLVSATRDKFEQIEKLVAEMDQEGAGAQVTKVISVNNADARDVAQSLMSIFIWQGQRTRRGQAPVRIQHLRGTNKILVSGSARQIEEIEQVVQTLDEAATAGQPEMRVIRLSYLAPSEAEQILTDYLRKSGARGRRGGEELAGNVRITASQTMGALIVSGSKEQLDRIEGLIGRLDQPVEEAGTAPRVIPLQTARASQLAETLTRIFTEPARQRARGRRATAEMVPVIVADELTNSLIVRAGSSDFLQIRKMAEQLDTQEAAGLAGVKVIQVAEGIDVRNLAQEIERTINQGEQHRARKMHTTPALVSIGVDERANALI